MLGQITKRLYLHEPTFDINLNALLPILVELRLYNSVYVNVI